MIKHSIEVTKPELVVYHQPSGPSYHNQEQYQKWLEAQTFKQGDFVTLLPREVAVSSLAQVNQINYVEPHFIKLEWSTYTRDHKPYWLVNCNMQHITSPWTRWDSVGGYRHLTANEIVTIISPVNDQLQAHCTKHGRQ